MAVLATYVSSFHVDKRLIASGPCSSRYPIRATAAGFLVLWEVVSQGCPARPRTRVVVTTKQHWSRPCTYSFQQKATGVGLRSCCVKTTHIYHWLYFMKVSWWYQSGGQRREVPSRRHPLIEGAREKHQFMGDSLGNAGDSPKLLRGKPYDNRVQPIWAESLTGCSSVGIVNSKNNYWRCA